MVFLPKENSTPSNYLRLGKEPSDKRDRKKNEENLFDIDLNKLLTIAQEKKNLSLEEKGEIRQIAKEIAEGKVVVIEFGSVVGYVCDGENTQAQQQIRELKGITNEAEHPFPLITSSNGFNKIIDLERTPSEFKAAAEKFNLPQGIHYRVKAKEVIEAQKEVVNLPKNCFSKDERGSVVQIIIFEDMLPKIQYLVEELSSLGVYYVVATSANQHGEPETTNYRLGKQLADEKKLTFFDGTLDSSLEYLPGSYPGLDVYPEKVVLFRPGHFHPEHIDTLMGRDIQRADKMKPPRYEYPTLSPWLLKVIFSMSPSIRNPFLYACAEAIKKKNIPTQSIEAKTLDPVYA